MQNIELDTTANNMRRECDTINFYRRPVAQLANLHLDVEVSGDMLAVMKTAAKPYTEAHVRHAAMSEAADARLNELVK